MLDKHAHCPCGIVAEARPLSVREHLHCMGAVSGHNGESVHSSQMQANADGSTVCRGSFGAQWEVAACACWLTLGLHTQLPSYGSIRLPQCESDGKGLATQVQL